MNHMILTSFLVVALSGSHHVACFESSELGRTSSQLVWNNVSFTGTQPFVGILKGAADEVSRKVFNVSYVNITLICVFRVSLLRKSGDCVYTPRVQLRNVLKLVA